MIAELSRRDPVRVLLACTGVDVFNRGIESFARECFEGLRGRSGLDVTLLKSSGVTAPGERFVPCLKRTGTFAKWIGHVIRRSPYTVEQLSSFLPIVREIRLCEPHVVYTSEANLAFQLHRWRRFIGVPFRLLLSNGAPLIPPFHRVDYVHHVTPVHRDLALAAGENPERHYMVPYGIRVPSSHPWVDLDAKISIRRRLQLPEKRRIVLSVGHVGRNHKRMDTLVSEVARIPSSQRPYLVILGNITTESAEVIRQAEQQLGNEGFAVRSVPYADVWPYYQAADIFTFVLAHRRLWPGLPRSASVRSPCDSTQAPRHDICPREPRSDHRHGHRGRHSSCLKTVPQFERFGNRPCHPV